MNVLNYSALMGLLLFLASCGDSRGGSSGQARHLMVTAREMSFSPAMIILKEGVPVHLEFQNSGGVVHDMIIPGLSSASKQNSNNNQHHGDADGHQKEGMGGHHNHSEPAVGSHVAANPGKSSAIHLVPSKKGDYEFYCSESGHKEAGMTGIIRVE